MKLNMNSSVDFLFVILLLLATVFMFFNAIHHIVQYLDDDTVEKTEVIISNETEQCETFKIHDPVGEDSTYLVIKPNIYHCFTIVIISN